MADNRLPPMEEARVRTAALVAAQRMSWDVPRHVLDYIVATSDPRQGPAALEMRAAGIVEYVRNHPSAPNFRDDREAQGFFRMIHGQVVSRFGGLPWMLAMAREEEASDRSSGSASYDSELVGDNMITPGNYHRSRFGRCGISHGLYQDLLGQGYTRDQVYDAGRQANLLGFRGDQRMVRSQALIQRYDNDADATNRAMLAYREAIHSDRDLADLMARANTATGEARRAIEEQIRQRYQHLRQVHGVESRLADPGNSEPARRGIRESGALINEQLEESRGFIFQFGVEAFRTTPDAEIAAAVPTPLPSGQTTRVADRADALFDEPAVVPATTTHRADAAAPERPGQGRQLAQNTVQPSGPRLTG